MAAPRRADGPRWDGGARHRTWALAASAKVNFLTFSTTRAIAPDCAITSLSGIVVNHENEAKSLSDIQRNSFYPRTIVKKRSFRVFFYCGLRTGKRSPTGAALRLSQRTKSASMSGNGGPGAIRTRDLCLRRATLYPAELRDHAPCLHKPGRRNKGHLQAPADFAAEQFSPRRFDLGRAQIGLDLLASGGDEAGLTFVGSRLVQPRADPPNIACGAQRHKQR